MSRPSIRWAVVAPCAILCLASVTAARAGTLLPPAADRVLWLAADTGVSTSGTTVTGWQDAGSAAAWIESVVGAPQVATATFNNGSHPVIRFDGNDGLNLLNDAALRLSPISIYVVASIDANSQGQQFLSNYTDQGGCCRGFVAGVSDGTSERVKWFTGTSGGNVNSHEPAIGQLTPEQNYVLSFTYNGGTKNLFVNRGSPVTAVGTPLGYDAGTTARIGVLDPGNRQFLTGDIAEVLVYSSVNDSQRRAVERYLGQKYGLATPPPTLTGMTLFGANANGTQIISDRWNSGPVDAAWDIFVRSGGSFSDPFINGQNNQISLPLSEGTHTYTFQVDHAGAALSYYGANFFFGGDQSTPSISVVAPTHNGGAVPAFAANGATPTMGLPITDIPASGSLAYQHGTTLITLTGWRFSNDTVDARNDVSSSSPTPGGLNDFTGQFTFKVEKKTTWDISGDFNVNLGNPNGAWQYGYESRVAGAPSPSTFTRYNNNVNTLGNSLDIWYDSAAAVDPNVTHNPTASDYTNYGVTWSPGEVSLGPGVGGDLRAFTVARWTAPIDGTYEVNVQFLDNQTGGDATDVYVYLNNLQYFTGSAGTTIGLGTGFHQSIALSAGDTLDFIVGPGADNSGGGNNTQLFVQITIPEPSTLALLALAGVCLGGCAAFRRRT